MGEKRLVLGLQLLEVGDLVRRGDSTVYTPKYNYTICMCVQYIK